MVKLTKRDLIFISILVVVIILVSIILSFSLNSRESFGINRIGTLDYRDMSDRVEDWNFVVDDIKKSYNTNDSFLIVTNKSSICHLASALSFMLEGNNKPVIITLMEDLNNARIQASKTKIPEVMIYNNGMLFRGNRCKLASNGLISTVSEAILSETKNLGRTNEHFNPMYVNGNMKIAIVRVHPGMTADDLRLLSQNLDGLILETYDNPITPMDNTWTNAIAEISQIIPVIIVSAYPHSTPELATIYVDGVIDGKDMTSETAMAKLYFLMSNIEDKSVIPVIYDQVLRGECRPSYKPEYLQ